MGKMETIDLVYTYVDSGDIQWKESFLSNLKANYNPTRHNIDAASVNRFRSRDEIKVSLKYLDKNATWIRNIYIVAGQDKPEWLPSEIIWIRHEEIINPEYLPTFNSHAIEANLHRIPGLAEYFIYSNDDFMITKPVNPEDFLTPDGKIQVFLDPAYSKEGEPNSKEIGFRSAWKNVNNLLNKEFGPRRREKMAHAPVLCSKSICQDIWDKFPNEMEATTRSKFRSIADINLLTAYYPWYCLHTEKAIISEKETKTLYIRTENQNELLEYINRLNTTETFLCIEDEGGEDSQVSNAIKILLERE